MFLRFRLCTGADHTVAAPHVVCFLSERIVWKHAFHLHTVKRPLFPDEIRGRSNSVYRLFCMGHDALGVVRIRGHREPWPKDRSVPGYQHSTTAVSRCPAEFSSWPAAFNGDRLVVDFNSQKAKRPIIRPFGASAASVTLGPFRTFARWSIMAGVRELPFGCTNEMNSQTGGALQIFRLHVRQFRFLNPLQQYGPVFCTGRDGDFYLPLHSRYRDGTLMLFCYPSLLWRFATVRLR